MILDKFRSMVARSELTSDELLQVAALAEMPGWHVVQRVFQEVDKLLYVDVRKHGRIDEKDFSQDFRHKLGAGVEAGEAAEIVAEAVKIVREQG